MVVISPSGQDDTDVINQALSSNRYIELTEGDFIISNSLILDLKGNNLKGQGKGLTRITANRIDGDQFTMIVNTGTCTGNYVLDGFSLFANCQGMTDLLIDDVTKRARGIDIIKSNGSIIRNIAVYDTGLRGIGITSSRECLIENCHVENIGYIPLPNRTDTLWMEKADGNGISLSLCKYSKILNCTGKNVRDLHFTHWASVLCETEGCTAQGTMISSATVNTRGAFSIESTGGNNTIKDCIVDNITGDCIQLTCPRSILKNINYISYQGIRLSHAGDWSNSYLDGIVN